MEHIVFLDRASVDATVRKPEFVHTWQDYPATSAAQVIERLRDATIAISNKVPLRAPALAQLPHLRLIAASATGTDHIDLEYCQAHGVTVANIRDYAVHSVPEHVFMLVLALKRNLLAYRLDVNRGRWQKSEQFCLFTHPIADLHGGTLAIVGRGGLGRAVARLAEAFGMRVLFAERKQAPTVRPGYTAFVTVLREADVISLHCPLTPETRHLIGAPELAAMSAHTLLINTARGGLVDEAALAEALIADRIGGAGFDVLSQEPPRAGNPLLTLDLPNFILTPHVGWASHGAMQGLVDQLVDNIEAFVRGQPRNVVV